jgi:hypothetical protein
MYKDKLKNGTKELVKFVFFANVAEPHHFMCPPDLGHKFDFDFVKHTKVNIQYG